MAFDKIPIGKFSLITRFSPKALRLYDDRGLLVPEVKDLCTAYRLYTGAQIPLGVSIKTLSGLGFSLSEIDVLLAAKAARGCRHYNGDFRQAPAGDTVRSPEVTADRGNPRKRNCLAGVDITVTL